MGRWASQRRSMIDVPSSRSRTTTPAVSTTMATPAHLGQLAAASLEGAVVGRALVENRLTVADACRAILDGHIVLSRDLANQGHYPAIDVMASVSRVMRDVSEPDHIALREKAVNIMASYKKAEDMITIGAYVDGSDPQIDLAKKLMPRINQFLRQNMDIKKDHKASVKGLKKALEVKK